MITHIINNEYILKTRLIINCIAVSFCSTYGKINPLNIKNIETPPILGMCVLVKNKCVIGTWLKHTTKKVAITLR
jgi:hypothetical protein